MKQRSSFSITTLILLTLQQKPLTKTRLTQELVLHYRRVGYYCDLLLREGLVKYDEKNHTYAITARGAEVLKLSEGLADLLSPVEQMIEKYSYCIKANTAKEYPLGKLPMSHATN